MLEIFKNNESEKLKGFLVWLPMIKGDTALSAEDLQSIDDPDRRLMHGWDKQRTTGEAFARVLGLKKTAWDVYLVYTPEAQWKDDLPPAPHFWMHQLTSDPLADPKLHLQPDRLDRAVKEAIGLTRLNRTVPPL